MEQAVSRALDAVGRPRRLALVVPDAVAKVSLIRFEKVPTSGHDLEALIRWQMRKSVPFRVDEAQVTWAEGQSLEAGGREFVVAVARRDIVAQYEKVVSRGGSHVGLVDLATFNLVNLVLAQEAPRRLAAGPRRRGLDDAGHRAARAGHFLPSAWRRRGGKPGRPRASVEDVLRGSAVGSRLRTRASFPAPRRGPKGSRARTGCAGCWLIGCRRKWTRSICGRSATLTDRISASPALVDQLAPLVGILSREPAA